MNTIEFLLQVIAGVAIVLAIVFVEMVAVSIAEAINQEQDEESEDNKDI